MKINLSKNKVRSLYTYKEGELFRLKNRGKKAGWLCKSTGYFCTEIEDHKIYIHKLVWIFHNGKTNKIIDHINRIRTDNRIENLRTLTASESLHNTKTRKNKSGFRGVTLDKRNGTYIVRLKLNKKEYYGGRFDNPIKAAKAYDKIAFELLGNLASLNFKREV